MDILGTIKGFDTWGVYPFATLIHWLVGFWCGCQMETSIVKRTPSRVISACLVFTAWMVYETVEFVALPNPDRPDIDIANGIIGLFLGVAITHGWHWLRGRLDG